MLDAIWEAGYDGVEIAQHPAQFGSAEELYGLLKRDDEDNPKYMKAGKTSQHRTQGLKLIGLAGGSIEERVSFLDRLITAENLALLDEKSAAHKFIRFDNYYPYIYIDTWNDSCCRELMERHYTLALHPHMFKPVQTAKEAEKLLEAHPALRFLPDTAHLTVAGEKVLEVLDKNYDRIVAVHLKDWTPEFGRSYQFYSTGFSVRFGEGDVQLDNIVDFLKSRRYNKWLIVEQDVVENPCGAAQAHRRWLKDTHGI